MKSRKGSICAIGFMLPRQQVIHGHPVRKGNIGHSSRSKDGGIYPDKFGEDDLHKGVIVEWPRNMISKVADPSPMHTRSTRKRT